MTVSIVIPTLNEEDNIAGCLDALMKQTVKPDEIIVVDDGSTDRTVKIARKYNVILVDTDPETRGVNAARHAGTLRAISDIVVQTDADVVAPPDWIERIVAHFEGDPELIGVCGSYKDFYGRLVEGFTLTMSSNVLRGLGGNSAYLKDAYLETDGYDEYVPIAGSFVEQGEDIVLWKKLSDIGKTIYDPTLFVYHKSKSKWRFTGIAIISVASIISGYIMRLINKGGISSIGNLLIGIGAGIMAGEIGHMFLHDNMEVPHHDAVGALGVATIYTLDKTDIIKNKPLAEGGMGFFVGALLHHFMTEGCSFCVTDPEVINQVCKSGVCST